MAATLSRPQCVNQFHENLLQRAGIQVASHDDRVLRALAGSDCSVGGNEYGPQHGNITLRSLHA